MAGIFDQFIGKRLLFRTYASGVHCALLEAFDYANSAALVTKSYRLWQWKGDGVKRLSLSAVAAIGAHATDRVDIAIPVHGVMQVIELIPVAPQAIASLTTPRNNFGVGDKGYYDA